MLSLCLLYHFEHLVLVVKVESVAALCLHEGGATAKHAPESLTEGAVELLNASPSDAVHGEVDTTTLRMNVHVRSTCKLCGGVKGYTKT